MSAQLRQKREGRVLTVTLNNPPHNFITTQMTCELAALVEQAEADEDISVVVLTGQDHVFISHFDVAEIAEGGDEAGKQLTPGGASVVLKLLNLLLKLPGLEAKLSRGPMGGIVNLIRMHRLFEAMERSPVVFIAAINGRALGGGFELALACDFRLIGVEHGCLGFPELNQGIIPGAGGTQRLTRALGLARASAMILDSQLIDGKTAEAWGLVQACVPQADLPAQAQELAQGMARRSRQSVAAAKNAMQQAWQAQGGLQEQIGFLAAASMPVANGALRHYHRRLQSLSQEPHALEQEIATWRAGQAYDLHQDKVQGEA